MISCVLSNLFREVVVWPQLLENAMENRNENLSHQAIHEMYPVSSSPPVLHHEEPQPEQQLLGDDLHVVPQVQTCDTNFSRVHRCPVLVTVIYCSA